MIHHGGRWERSTYIDGEFFVAYIDSGTINRANLVDLIREGLGYRNETEYTLWYVTNINGIKAKVLLRGDMELLRWLADPREDPEVYVIEKGGSSGPDSNVSRNTMRGCTSAVHHDQRMPYHEEDDEEVFDEDYEEDEAESTSEDDVEDRRNELRHFSSDYQTASYVEHEHGSRDWDIPFPHIESILQLGWEEYHPIAYGLLEVGAIFRSKVELRIAIGIYHLEHYLEFATDRSTDSRAVYICKSGRKNCTFRLCAVEAATLWRITKLTLDHTCQADLNRVTTARSVSGEVAAYYFAKKLIDEKVVLRPKEMIAEMRSKYGVQMLYCFAVRTRQQAIERTYGDFNMSYVRLPSYLYLLKQRNPGTVYDLQTTREGVFCHMFVALGQSIRAFEQYLRPVIVIDGTHLKGKNRGVLFVAVTKDGNDQVFPLAIGLGPIENDESWTYFLYNLRRCYNPPEDLLIVSDQHKSIRNAVQAVYPNAFHGLCYHHLLKNLTPYGKTVATVFYEAAYSYRHEVFEKIFSLLHDASPDGAHRRLSQIGPERWARSKCPVQRYGFMTSNAAESFNSRLWWARRLPVCSLLESFRTLLEDWFDERRTSSESRDHVLTVSTFNKLSNSVQASLSLTVRATTGLVYKVEEDDQQYQVDLQNWTCECREFDEDKIPCKHAVAAIRWAGNGLNVYDFVHKYFKQYELTQTYAEHVSPIPHPSEWNVPGDVLSIYCSPPDPETLRQSGRPKMSRTRSTVEGLPSRRRQVCSRCNGTGHNRKKCTISIPVGGVDLNVPFQEAEFEETSQDPSHATDEPSHDTEEAQPTQRRRKKKRCSNCGEEGHDIRACPMPLRE
ncbi:uncharacterized protein LOC130989711 [Salvia miltiorrhiza]|uniref:uncharacterized protein LOC130989711 n=1 Tax=Salvia miltiorrhiza TaxID=226208 RepID=UPI0025AD246D|nr:uncharacterized protein LOC130989711 [Salvia miltiorrhiza]